MGKIVDLERLLKAVGNRKRLEILQELRKHRTLFSSDIAHAIGMSRAATSQHLRILRNAGIVEFTKRGLEVSYRISLDQEPPVQAVLRML